MTTDEKREKIFLAVLDYAQAYGYEDNNEKWCLAKSEMLSRDEKMQIDAQYLVEDLLDILNGEG